MTTREFNAFDTDFHIRLNSSDVTFDRIAAKWMLNRQQFINYCIANTMDGVTWPTDMTTSSYHVWQARVKSLSYNFRKETKVLFDNSPCLPIVPEVFLKLLMESVARKEMCYETATMISHILGLRNTKVNIILEPQIIKIVKYVDFLPNNPEKYRKILSETLREIV